MSVLKTYTKLPPLVPSHTFRVTESGIEGTVDGLEAVVQAARLALQTPRYHFQIFSEDYGSQLEELVGKPRKYTEGVLEELITETLLEDDRILGVRDFSQQFRGEKAEASFTLETTLGTVSMTWDQEERT